jgi:hypothetical protein
MSAIKGSVRNFLLGRPEPVKKETPADKLAPSLWEKKQLVYNAIRKYQDGEYNNRCVLVGQLDVALSGLYDELVKIL